jgi:hypothetical protein
VSNDAVAALFDTDEVGFVRHVLSAHRRDAATSPDRSMTSSSTVGDRGQRVPRDAVIGKTRKPRADHLGLRHIGGGAG